MKRVRRKPVEVADPDATVAPSPAAVTQAVGELATSGGAVDAAELDVAILRVLRRKPNRTVELGPLAQELGIDPYRVQLAVEDLGRRRMVVVPFIEPHAAGGATLTASGLRWLLEREGGTPSEPPVALRPATKRVRPDEEAARLPRAQVYGVSRGS